MKKKLDSIDIAIRSLFTFAVAIFMFVVIDVNFIRHESPPQPIVPIDTAKHDCRKCCKPDTVKIIIQEKQNEVQSDRKNRPTRR